MVTLSLTAAKLKKLAVDGGEYWRRRGEINKSDDWLVSKKARLMKLDYDYIHVVSDAYGVKTVAKEIQGIGLQWLKDLVNEHIEPQPDNYYYHSVNFLKNYKHDHVIREFLAPGDAWEAKDLIPGDARASRAGGASL